MPDPSDSPSLQTLIRAAMDARLIDVHTAMPGRVETYDEGSQTADVRPQLKRVVRRANGERVAEELPVIPCVPVKWPRGGGFTMTLPLVKGDFGMLIFHEYSIDRWRTQGEQVDPADERRHGLSGAEFIPGIHPQSAKLASAAGAGDGARLGKDGGYFIEVTDGETRLPNDAATFLARADRTLSELTAIVGGFNSHTHLHAAGTGGSVPTATPLPQLAAASDPKSDTVKGT